MILKQLIKRATDNAEEGVLCVAESQTQSVPFEIKRVYYTCGVKAGVTRGHHAHKELEQLLICPHGEISVQMDDGKGGIETVILNDPSQGLYVGPLMWHTMKWNKSDSVLLVLASDHYREDDYIRSYEDFLSIAAKEGRKENFSKNK